MILDYDISYYNTVYYMLYIYIHTIVYNTCVGHFHWTSMEGLIVRLLQELIGAFQVLSGSTVGNPWWM